MDIAGTFTAVDGTGQECDVATSVRQPPFKRRGIVFCLLAGAIGCLVYWLAHAGLTDDGYITLDYARTLAEHGTWGMHAGMEANTATSPANVLLLAALMVLTRLLTGEVHPIVVLGVLTVALMVATGAWWAAASRRLQISLPASITGLVLVLLSPLTLSAVGLETTLAVALLVGLFAEALRGRPMIFGLLAGAAVLTRLDLIVFVVLIGFATAAIRRQWWRALLPMLVVALPWFITSWFVLGSAIPDTLAIKQQQNYSGGWTFLTGPGLFLGSYTMWPSIVAFAPAILGILAVPFIVRKRGRLLPIGLWGIASVIYYAVYILLDVPPYVWYYVPTVATLTFVFSAALDPLGSRLRRSSPRPVVTVFGITTIACTLILDLGHGVPWQTPPIFGNAAQPADYMRVGHELRPILGKSGMQAPGELGTLLFSCDCKVLDQFSDRGSAIPFLRRQVDQAGPLTHWIYVLNYHNLDWQQQPLPRKYRLEWHRKWMPPKEWKTRTWYVNSSAIGPGRFVLLPYNAPSTPHE